MKKLIKLVLICSTMFFTLLFSPNYIAFATEEYYINKMDVKVELNNKKEYKITENIDVYFNEPKHGFKRKIPLCKTSENREDYYEIMDIKVDGDKYEIISAEDNNEIKIGDPNKKVTGKKTYKITYTMKYFVDEAIEDNKKNSLYLNLLGDGFDTKIKEFTGKIVFQKNSKVISSEVYSGSTGTAQNEYVDYRTNDGEININSIKAIDKNNAVTVSLKFSNNIFNETPIRTVPFTIKNQDVTIGIDEKQQYNVEIDYIVQRNAMALSENFFINYCSENDFVRISGISSEGAGRYYGNREIQIPNKVGENKIKVRYKVKKEVDTDIVNITNVVNFIDGVRGTLKIKSPFPIDKILSKVDENRFDTQVNDNEIIIKPIGNLSSNSELSTLNFSVNGKFKNNLLIYKVIAICISIFLSLIVYLYYKKIKKSENNNLVYGDNSHNVLEFNYIYNSNINERSIVLLIIEWSKRGFIEIEVLENNEFVLTKLEDLRSCKEYEKDLFDKIFAYGNGERVNSYEIKEDFCGEINEIKKNIKCSIKDLVGVDKIKNLSAPIMFYFLTFIPLLLLDVVLFDVGGGNLGVIMKANKVVAITNLIALVILIIVNNYKRNSIEFNEGIKTKRVIILPYAVIQMFLCSSYSESIIVTLPLSMSMCFIIVVSSMVPKRNYAYRKFWRNINGYNLMLKDKNKTIEGIISTLDRSEYDNFINYIYILKFADVFIDDKLIHSLNLQNFNDGEFNKKFRAINSCFTIIKEEYEERNKNNYREEYGSTTYYGGDSSDSGGYSGGGDGGGGGSSW